MLGQAIIDDLIAGREFFAEVAGLANGPVITPLRALDIVAWHAGRSLIGPAIWAAATPRDLDVAADGQDPMSIDPDDESP